MRCQLKLGFTLIEVLVTLVILMFGMLGIAGLMAKGQRVSFEAYQRHQALQIANEMAERLRANRFQAAAYATAAPVPGVGTGTEYTAQAAGTCSTGPACTPAQLVAYDVALWVGLLQGQGEVAGAVAVGGILNPRGCIEAPPIAAIGPFPAPPANTYRISVAWQGNEDLGAVVYPSACGNGLYGLPGQRRVVSIDVSAN